MRWADCLEVACLPIKSTVLLLLLLLLPLTDGNLCCWAAGGTAEVPGLWTHRLTLYANRSQRGKTRDHYDRSVLTIAVRMPLMHTSIAAAIETLSLLFFFLLSVSREATAFSVTTIAFPINLFSIQQERGKRITESDSNLHYNWTQEEEEEESFLLVNHSSFHSFFLVSILFAPLWPLPPPPPPFLSSRKGLISSAERGEGGAGGDQ